MLVLTWLWDILKSVLNFIAKLIVFAVLATVALLLVGSLAGDGLPRNMVLELDLRRAMDDKSQPSVLDIGQGRLAIMDVVLGLDAAARDPRVKGLFLRVGSGDLSVPKAEELRDALKRFQAGGKFVVAHSQSFYSNGLGDYGVAAAANEIWMQPVSTFFSAGSAATTVFYKGLFDKINATPQFVQRYEYKNAANVFTETDFTPAHREATSRVLQSWYDSATQEAAADRKLEKTALIEVLDSAPLQAEEVLAKGLISKIGYDEDAREAARMKGGQNAAVTRFARYAQATRGRTNDIGRAHV